MKTLEIKKGDKVTIRGNGNQAPYGIGEIIEIIPAAHIRKVKALIGQYYNGPTMEINGRVVMLSYAGLSDNPNGYEELA
jgi:hypothetical protein